MARKLGWIALMLVASLPAAAQAHGGSISGQVRNSSGVPQMGAMVRVFTTASAAGTATTVFTDEQGHYSASNLGPGTYQVKVSAPSFLPSLRENVALRAGAHMVVNVTLNTLFEAIQLIPPGTRAPQDEEDWKWTLRSAVNRPILRLRDDGPLVVVSRSENGDDRALKASVAFLAGADGQGFGGSSDMTTAFDLQTSLFSAGTVSLKGNVGYGTGRPSTVVRAAYSHQMANGSHPEVAFTMRRFATPDSALHNAALQTLALTLNDRTTLGNFLELQYGGEFQSIQFLGHVNTFRPFGSVGLHLSPNTILEYRYATSVPNLRRDKGFDTAPADLSETSPRISMLGGDPEVEKARHQEVSLSRRIGANNFQAALYSDRVRNLAMTGVGEISAESGDYLPDVYSGTFTYNGGTLNTNGVRLVAERRVVSDVTATIDYAWGGVLDVAPSAFVDGRTGIRTERRHALAGKLAGRLPGSGTRWIASYRWTSGPAITPVDMFNASPGQTDPYFSLFLRQPIPGTGFLPGHMEALVDVRNLLAQGYVPVVAQDGHTLYLVQSARSLRGGLAFTF